MISSSGSMAHKARSQLTTLLKSLISLEKSLPSAVPDRWVSPRRNATAILRRLNVVSLLVHELLLQQASSSMSPPPSSSSLLPQSLILPSGVLLFFRELKCTMQKVKLLFKSFQERSCIWQVLEHESLSHALHNINQDMANALDILPLHLLHVSNEIKEQIHLIYSHLRRIQKPQVDPTIISLCGRILSLIQEDINKIDVAELHYIFTSLHLSTYAICNQELELLAIEMHTQAGTGGIPAVCTIKNLTRFVKHAQCVLFGAPTSHVDMDWPRISCAIYPEDFFTSSLTSPLSATVEGPVIPDEFRCPISLDLMCDPVVIATGHTYDRESISKWVDNGHRTCPKSGQRLLHMLFIPNYALRRMIQKWCDDHSIPYDRKEDSCIDEDVEEDHILSQEEALAMIKETVADLVGKLAAGSLDVQRHVACKLRLLTKCGIENRICIAEAGAIPFLVPLLTSPDEKTQENAVTAMLNLSICENNKSLIMAAGALDAVVEVLRVGATMTARENAAATLFSLSMVNGYRLAIGEKSCAIAALVALLKEGTSRGKKDAATALFHLCIFSGNKPKVVNAGAIPVLLHLLSDERACITDDALSVLAVLAESEDGCAAIDEGKATPVLVELLRLGSEKGKENAVVVLLALCKHGGKHVIRSLARMDMALPYVRAIAELGTSARAKRKASSLLKLLHKQLLPH